MDFMEKALMRNQALSFLGYGMHGYSVSNDENGRTIKRVSAGVNTLPECVLYQRGEFVRCAIVTEAVDFLMGDIN